MPPATPVCEAQLLLNSFAMCTYTPSCWTGPRNSFRFCTYKTASHLHIPQLLKVPQFQSFAPNPHVTLFVCADPQMGEGVPPRPTQCARPLITRPSSLPLQSNSFTIKPLRTPKIRAILNRRILNTLRTLHKKWGGGAIPSLESQNLRSVGRRLSGSRWPPATGHRSLPLDMLNSFDCAHPAAPLMAQKLGFISLGCPKNLVDSEVMMGILSRHGYELTPRPEEADVLVVNTCSFIEPAQQESVNTILEMAEFKRTGRARRLVVAGCLVERFGKQIQEQIPDVDALVGTGDVERILEATEGGLRELPPTPPEFLYHDLSPRVLTTPREYAYIKINEGCDHPCTFCIIPELRGKFRSRRFESVVREAEQLAQQGVREVILIGQDTTAYGEDLGIRDGLPSLLERLAA